MINLKKFNKEVREAMDKEEKDVAFNREKYINISTGEQLELPRLTIGRILSISAGIAALAKSAKKEAPELFSDKAVNPESESFGFQLVQSLPVLLPVLSGEIINLLSTYLKKEPEWIKENLNLEDLAMIVTPLFANLLSQGNSLVKAINDTFKKNDQNK